MSFVYPKKGTYKNYEYPNSYNANATNNSNAVYTYNPYPQRLPNSSQITNPYSNSNGRTPLYQNLYHNDPYTGVYRVNTNRPQGSYPYYASPYTQQNMSNVENTPNEKSDNNDKNETEEEK